MLILAIDPGNEESAYVLIDEYYKIHDFAKVKNEELTECIKTNNFDELAIEMVASYGMAVGESIFETVFWIGRFWEAAQCEIKKKIYRKEEKMNLCGSMKAKDANIRQALIDRFAQHDKKNGKGTKANPDTFFGFKSDIWAAMAVGTTYIDLYHYGKGWI